MKPRPPTLTPTKTKNNSGQALIEALFVTVLLLGTLTALLSLFAFGILRARTELEMHEALICSVSQNSIKTKNEVRNLCLGKLKLNLAKILTGAQLTEAKWTQGRGYAQLNVKILFIKRRFDLTKSILLPLQIAR